MPLLRKLRKQSRKNQGFTLVEMLVVAPLVLLVIAGLVAAMVTMVGDSLAASGRTTMSYNMQDTLDRIEQDSRVAINFMSTFNYFSSPQGRDGGTQAFSFSANKDLILTQQATTTSPYDTTRDLVYYANQPNSCTPASNAIGNRVLVSRTIYFLKNGSLWRRTVVNPWNQNGTADTNTVCSAPWQRDTCPEGSTVGSGSSNNCNGVDEELLKNVTDFTPTFYTSAGTATSDPASATTVNVSITVTKPISGEDVAQTSTLRSSRLNDVPTTPLPTTPTLSIYNPSVDTYNNPILVSFKWSASNATAYSYQTSTDNVNWTTAIPTTNTYTSVSVAYAGQPAYIRVTAYNDQGNSATASSGATYSVGRSVCSLQNGWEDYGSPYGPATYTQTSTKIVLLHGLIRYGTATNGTVLCTLPEGFRPDHRLIFQLQTSGATTGRVDVNTDGNVIFVYGSSTWLSLDQIAFIADGGASWSGNLTGQNGWVNYGSVYSNVVATQDSIGRNHIQGLAKSGTTTNTTSMFVLPSNYAADGYDIYPSACSVGSAVQLTTTGYMQARGIPCNGYLSTQLMWWPSGTTGWSTPALGSGWTRYSATYSNAQYKKGSDNIVSLRGLIKGGTTTSGTVLFTLPSGYRPLENLLCTTITYDSSQSSGAGARIDVNANGQVIVREGVLNAWVSLAGCDFYADGS